MKKSIIICLLALVSITVMAQKEKTKEKAIVTLNVPMDGHCCIDEINQGVGFEKGIKNIKCNLDEQTVTITYRADKTDVDSILEAFAKIDKKATIKPTPEME